MKTDQIWLGDEEELGPFVRAGLGILLAKGDWTWWHHPGATSTVMLDAVRTSGIAVWGGDPAVLTANEWLDASTAVEVAHAFQKLVARRGGNLKLKVDRRVYSWNLETGIQDVIEDIAKAFNRQHIFAEWPSDRRPRRQLQSSRDGQQLTVISSGPQSNSAGRLANSLDRGTLVQSAKVASIAVGSFTEILSMKCYVDMVIVVDVDKRAAINRLDEIRNETGAQAAIFLPANQVGSDVWFSTLGQGINNGNTIIDALVLANAHVALKAELIAVTQQFILHSSKFFFVGDVSKVKSSSGEDAGDTAVLATSRRALPQLPSRTLPLTNLEIEGVRMKALPPVIRLLRAVAKHEGKSVQRFPASGNISIAVSIDPISPLEKASVPFPDHEIAWDSESAVLQVHMISVDAEAVTRKITVPRVGSSQPVEFDLEIFPGLPVDVRFLIADGARILQTGRLSGLPLSHIDFYVESVNTAIYQQKDSFDLALLVNNSLGDTPSATILTKTGIRLELLGAYEITSARDELRFTLESAVMDPTKELAPVLFDLANQGKLIFDELKQHTEGWPDRLDRVQLTTQGDVFFPIECLYDGEIPENASGGLCSERDTCLSRGSARESCSIRSALQQLCPMGFLGITTTIERQTWDKDMEKATWLRQAKDPENRTKITNLRRPLFAAADRADHFKDSDVAAGFDIVRISDVEHHTGIRQTNWQQWKEKILAVQPNLIVLLPHIEKNTMHIGAEEVLAFASVRDAHVGSAEPVVIAMGCNTAVGFAATAGLPAVLLRRGARIVVAALTGVLGRYANIATRDLVGSFVEAASADVPTSVGEILTQIRRDFLAHDNLLGMVLIAFGDADYILGGKEIADPKNV